METGYRRSLLAALLVACCLRPSYAAERYAVFGWTPRELQNAKGPGLATKGERAYRERWPGVKGSVIARYTFATGATPRLARIRLDFPGSLRGRELERALAARMGLPSGRAWRYQGHLYAEWVWQGLRRSLSWDPGGARVTLVRAPYRMRTSGGWIGAVILQDGAGRVTGPRSPDALYLAGIPFEPDDIWMKALYLVVRHPQGKSPAERVFPLGFGGLVDSTMQVRDYTGDGRPEILVSAPTGGSGGLSQYALVTLRGGALRPLVSSTALSDGPALSVTFADGFRARVFCVKPHRRWRLDLHRFKREYIDTGIYSAQGRLLRPATGAVDGAALLRVRGTGGRPTLVTSRKIWGTYHANAIGIVETRWRWSRGRLRVAGMAVRPWPR